MCLDWVLSLLSHPLSPISCWKSILFISVNSKTWILCSIVCGKPRIFFVTLCSLGSPCLTYLLPNPFYLVVIKCLSAVAMQSQGCVCVFVFSGGCDICSGVRGRPSEQQWLPSDGETFSNGHGGSGWENPLCIILFRAFLCVFVFSPLSALWLSFILSCFFFYSFFVGPEILKPPWWPIFPSVRLQCRKQGFVGKKIQIHSGSDGNLWSQLIEVKNCQSFIVLWKCFETQSRIQKQDSGWTQNGRRTTDLNFGYDQQKKGKFSET